MAPGTDILHSYAKTSTFEYLYRDVHMMLKSKVFPWLTNLLCSQAVHLHFASRAILRQQANLSRNIMKNK